MNFFNAKLYQVKSASKELAPELIQGKLGAEILILMPKKKEENAVNFLSKVFAAVQKDFQKDILLIEVDQHPLQWTQFCNQLSFNKVFLMGLEASSISLHLELKKYQCYSWNGFELLYTDSVEEIQQDKQKKQLLWNALQQLFKV